MGKVSRAHVIQGTGNMHFLSPCDHELCAERSHLGGEFAGGTVNRRTGTDHRRIFTPSYQSPSSFSYSLGLVLIKCQKYFLPANSAENTLTNPPPSLISGFLICAPKLLLLLHCSYYVIPEQGLYYIAFTLKAGLFLGFTDFTINYTKILWFLQCNIYFIYSSFDSTSVYRAFYSVSGGATGREMR